LHGYLREIDVLICTLLKATYPYILNEIQSANCNYHGNRPSYIGEEEMLSPRIVVSWQLGNEPHVDPKDSGLSVVVLVVVLNEIDMNEVPRDWRFVLQNLRTTEGDKQVFLYNYFTVLLLFLMEKRFVMQLVFHWINDTLALVFFMVPPILAVIKNTVLVMFNY